MVFTHGTALAIGLALFTLAYLNHASVLRLMPRPRSDARRRHSAATGP